MGLLTGGSNDDYTTLVLVVGKMNVKRILRGLAKSDERKTDR